MDLVAALLLGALIGLAVGAVGGGGSVLSVPLLVHVLEQPVHDATTASSLVVAAAGSAGAIGQARDGMVCWRCSATLAPAAAIGTLAGAFANQAVGDDVLPLALVPFMALAAAATWKNAGRPEGRSTHAQRTSAQRPATGCPGSPSDAASCCSSSPSGPGC